MNWKKIDDWIWLGLIAYYLIYNTIFGWNEEPINEWEARLDDIAKVWMILAFGWTTYPIAAAYRSWAEKVMDEDIKQ